MERTAKYTGSVYKAYIARIVYTSENTLSKSSRNVESKLHSSNFFFQLTLVVPT